MITPSDEAVVAAQLGRRPRGLRAVAHRCPCGLPDVVETAPRLADGTPFPTLYYLTCPRAAAAIGGLEAAGVMREMTARLAVGGQLRAAYARAHHDYLARRDAVATADGLEPLPAGTQSAGGMPDRVKCLHALAAHELAVPGTNPFGREAVTRRLARGGPAAPAFSILEAAPPPPAHPSSSKATVGPGGTVGRGTGRGGDVTHARCRHRLGGTNSIRLLIADLSGSHKEASPPGLDPDQPQISGTGAWCHLVPPAPLLLR